MTNVYMDLGRFLSDNAKSAVLKVDDLPDKEHTCLGDVLFALVPEQEKDLFCDLVDSLNGYITYAAPGKVITQYQSSNLLSEIPKIEVDGKEAWQVYVRLCNS